jgi:hypothetical protein
MFVLSSLFGVREWGVSATSRVSSELTEEREREQAFPCSIFLFSESLETLVKEDISQKSSMNKEDNPVSHLEKNKEHEREVELRAFAFADKLVIGFVILPYTLATTRAALCRLYSYLFNTPHWYGWLLGPPGG